MNEEKHLLLKVAEGDERAFRTLFEKYHGILATHIMRITRLQESTEEIVQDVFLKIWMSRETLSEIQDVRAYLYIVSKNHALDSLKKTARNDPRIQVFLNENDGFEGRIFQKYNKPNGANDLRPLQGGSVNNERILRMADVKLLAAEAAARTGDLATAILHLNDVRTRARQWGAASEVGNGLIPANHSASGADQATVLQWIMDERFVELAGEGPRWWDLKRWHAAGTINMSGWTGGEEHFSTILASPVQFDINKHLVFPLPQVEIERNSGILENNPGY